MNKKDCIREEVRRAISIKLQNHVPNQAQVNEGVGSFLVKTFGTIKGAGIGSFVGGFVGAGAGFSIAAVLAAAGFVSPAALVVGIYGGATVGWVAGLYKGAKFGLNTARKVTSKESTELANKLIETTHLRDEKFQKLAAEPENQKVQMEIDALTKKQMDIAIKLRKAAEFDKTRDLISNADYDFALRLIKQAEAGKLTYIEE